MGYSDIPNKTTYRSSRVEPTKNNTEGQRSFQQPGGVHPPTRLVSNADLFWADLGDNPDPDHPWDWYIYLHLVDSYGTCREIYHTWILWEINNRK